ncbi:MAG: cobalamin-dependent protein, partial [Candidatus Omnitrophica bacterium]|nr:cobalamin-dependent protein [Candidatus Omnitrophota bacterium]
MKIAFVSDSNERLGIEYLSGVLKAHGHEVRLFIDDKLFDDEYISSRYLSGIFDSKKRIVSELKVYKPDLIGLSMLTTFYGWACSMAALIKREMNVPIIFGGIHPTIVPERVIANDNVDIVCVGEGEYPLLELVQSMERGAIDYGIKNLWFKNGGRIIANDIRPLLGDLNELPFADKEIFYSARPHYAQTYYIVTGRGCAHACSYCGHSYLKELYRGKGPYLR